LSKTFKKPKKGLRREGKHGEEVQKRERINVIAVLPGGGGAEQNVEKSQHCPWGKKTQSLNSAHWGGDLGDGWGEGVERKMESKRESK